MEDLPPTGLPDALAASSLENEMDAVLRKLKASAAVGPGKTHASLYKHMLKFYKAVWPYRDEPQLGSFKARCARKLKLAAVRKNANVFQLVLNYAGGSGDARTINSWSMALRAGLNAGVDPDAFVDWMKVGGGVKKCASRVRKRRWSSLSKTEKEERAAAQRHARMAARAAEKERRSSAL